MSNQPTPTQAEYAAADAIAHWLGSDPAEYVKERIAQFIAAHRAEPPGLTVSQGQMTTDSARPHVAADPAQAHVAELIDVLARQFDTLERERTVQKEVTE